MIAPSEADDRAAAAITRPGIDAVFRIVGELRKSWRGITGGSEGTAAITRVLAELAAEAA